METLLPFSWRPGDRVNPTMSERSASMYTVLSPSVAIAKPSSEFGFLGVVLAHPEDGHVYRIDEDGERHATTQLDLFARAG